MKYLKRFNEELNNEIDDSPIRVKVVGNFKRDNAEKLIDDLSNDFNIGVDFIDSDYDSVTLDVYPYTDYNGTREDFENFVDSHEAFSRN